MFEWVRSFFRKTMKPIDPVVAQKRKGQFALIYAIMAWNIIGLTVYSILKDQLPKNPNNTVDYAKVLGVQDATVLKYSGFKKVNEYDIHLTQEEVDDFFKPETDESMEPSQMENAALVE